MVLVLRPAGLVPSESKPDGAGRASPRGSPERWSWDLPLFLFSCSCHNLSWDQENLFWKCLTAKTTCSQPRTTGFVLSDHVCAVWCLTSCWLEKMNLLFSSHIVHRQVPVTFQVLASHFFQPSARGVLRLCLSLTDEWTLATCTYKDITDGCISADWAWYGVVFPNPIRFFF